VETEKKRKREDQQKGVDRQPGGGRGQKIKREGDGRLDPTKTRTKINAYELSNDTTTVEFTKKAKRKGKT